MERRDQAQASAPSRVIGFRLLPSGSFFGRPYQYIAAQDNGGMVYIRLLLKDWEAVASEAASLMLTAQVVYEAAEELGKVTTITGGLQVIDLDLAR